MMSHFPKPIDKYLLVTPCPYILVRTDDDDTGEAGRAQIPRKTLQKVAYYIKNRN